MKVCAYVESRSGQKKNKTLFAINRSVIVPERGVWL